MNHDAVSEENSIEGPRNKKKRNKLKGYLFNFVLTFIAVFLGFWADSYREQLSEASKERQYISSLILNLKDDSVRLARFLPALRQKVRGLDSLTSMAKVDLTTSSNRGKVCKYIFTYVTAKISDHEFHTNTVTLSQLKNSGDLIVLQENHVADSIAKFDIVISGLQKQEAFVIARFEELVKQVWKVSDYTFVNPKDYTFSPNVDFPPFTADKQVRIEFFNSTWNYMDCLEHWIQSLEEHLNYTHNLISFLEARYESK